MLAPAGLFTSLTPFGCMGRNKEPLQPSKRMAPAGLFSLFMMRALKGLRTLNSLAAPRCASGAASPLQTAIRLTELNRYLC